VKTGPWPVTLAPSPLSTAKQPVTSSKLARVLFWMVGALLSFVPSDFMCVPLNAVVGWTFYGERLDVFVLLCALIIVSGVLWKLRTWGRAPTLS
jgi:hypothetical protein